MAKAVRTVDGKGYPASDWAYVPDPDKPSTWKLRLTESPGGDPDPGIVGAAVAALGKGFRGQRVQIPAEDRPKVIRRVRAAWLKAHPDKSSEDLPSILEATDPDSLDGRIDRIRRAWNAEHVPEGEGGVAVGAPWVVEVYDDAVIVEEGDEYRRYPVTVTDDAIRFGEPETVEPRAGWERTAEAVEIRETISTGTTLLESLDGGEGKVWRVTMVRPGTSKNRRRYRREVLAEAAPLYDGAKSFDGHRDAATRRRSQVSGLVGWFENVTPAGDGALEGDYHVASSGIREMFLSAWERKRPDLIGFSHDVSGITEDVVEGGQRITDVRKIVEVHSVDVVADPAAGGRIERLVASRGGIAEMTHDEIVALLDDDEELDAALRARYAGNGDGGAGDPKAPEGADGAGDNTGGDAAGAAEGEITEAYPVVLKAGSLLHKLAIREAVGGTKLPESVTGRLQESLAGEDLTEEQIAQRVTETAGVWEELLAQRPAPLPGQAPAVEIGQDEQDRNHKALDAMFAGHPIDGVRGFRSLKEAYARITGHYDDPIAGDFSRKILAESVGCFASVEEARRLTESISSGTWSSALGDSITRRAIAEYNVAPLQDWRPIVNVVPLNDFRTQRLDRVGGYDVLTAVSERGTYPALTSPSDEEATYSPSKYGGTEDLSWETIRNDDMRLVQRIPRNLGRAAGLTLYRAIFVTTLAGNATCSYDSTALFAAGHSNTTAVALGEAGIGTLRNLMVTQTRSGETSGFIGAIPKFLIVPSELFVTAFKLTQSGSSVAGGEAASNAWGAGDIPNPWKGLIPIECPLLTDANDWFLVADPRSVPTIEVGFLDGQEEPQILVQDQPTLGSVFTADVITYRVRHVWGLVIEDHRGFQRGTQ